MSKFNEISLAWRTKKHGITAEVENPFTTIGLLSAIIQDLNDIRLKIEYLENIVFQTNSNKFLFKEWSEKETFLND